FIHSVGKEVRFQIKGAYQEERKKENSWKLFLFADEIRLLDSVEQDNQFLREENERLRKRIAELEAEIEELKKTTKLYIGKFQAQQEENSSLALELGSMEEQLQTYEEQLAEYTHAEEAEQAEVSEAQVALKNLEKDYELLLDRYNRKQAQWSYISRSTANGQGKAKDWETAVEALSKEVEALRKENEQLKKMGEKFISSKGVPLGDTPIQPVYPQPEGMDKDPLLNWWHSLADDWRKAYAYIHDMNVDAPNLIVLEQILMGHELTLIGHHTMIPRSLPFKLQEVSGLSSLLELQTLNLSYNQIEDTHGLRHLQKLESLVMIGNPLQTLQGLAQLPLLTTLKIMQCGVSPAEIEWLQSKKPELVIEAG
ncbi:MAG: leucine-rich repeat domain-containing protein, partial [Bacteroidota bacterium]